jgi:hypothetical protein
MTPYRAEKEVSVLRADVSLLVERYLSLLESKYDLFLTSDELLSTAVHSIKNGKYESADDVLISHADLIEKINLADYEIASVVQQLSRITGIDDASTVVAKITIKEKNISKQKKDLVRKITDCATLSEKKLAFITESFEKKILDDNASLKSLEIVDALRQKIILPEK